jgi:adenine C2-methylase RlmN of 23S rRNA A2503 and tRNA A37
MTRAQLQEFFLGASAKSAFRAQQVMKWIHHQGVRDFAAMSNLSRDLRERLQGDCGGAPAGGGKPARLQRRHAQVADA